MPLTVVVGGQFGSEGKGKIVSYLALQDNVDIVVRCGGPNSGHTVDYRGQRYELRSLPAGFINQRTRLLLAAGSLINPEILLTEIKIAGIDPQRVGVDRNAGIISSLQSEEERSLSLRDRLGSTLSGTGSGVANRALRKPDFKLAKDILELQGFLTDVSEEANGALDRNGKVVIEGTQGFGLSVYHSPHYPYATSRDTTASGFLSEVGVSPRLVTDIIMAVRTYPIRVAGNSGPLAKEVTWEEIQRRSGYPTEIKEYTTTTKKLRRVGLFDIEQVKRAARVNRPTQIALHGADYLSYTNKSKTELDNLCIESQKFIAFVERETKTHVNFIGTSPRGMITVTGLNDLPCKVFTKNSPDRSLQNYLPPGESVRSSVFELEQTVRRVKETVRRFEIIISISALALLVAMAGLFFNAYSNLKNDIVTLSKSVGILEGAAGAARTNSSAAVQPNSQVASPTSPPEKSQQSSPPLRDNTSTTESPK